jgi:hypothetical protein
MVTNDDYGTIGSNGSSLHWSPLVTFPLSLNGYQYPDDRRIAI